MASVPVSDEPSIATPARSHPSPSPSRRTSSPPPPSSMTMQDPIMTLRRRRRRQSPDSDLGRTTTTTRRSSLLSDYSCDGLFSRPSPPPPQPPPPPTPPPPQITEKSTVASASLAFALLPAIAGVFFKDGHAVVTDIMLLSLAGVFLHWSVTQPWIWYHDAQQIRLRHAESALEDDYDDAVEDDDQVSHRQQPAAVAPTSTATTAAAATTTTTTTTTMKTKTKTDTMAMTRRQVAATRAVRELYLHEVVALVSCALLPLMSAYLLHAIRAQLSRPSEGLVSNYNLTIFLLMAEVRVCSHLLTLLRARTLHLQRAAHADELSPSADERRGIMVEELAARVAVLEAASSRATSNQTSSAHQLAREAAVSREVRNAIQPELDALNRAVRRYEKKATLLQMQTESRFSSVDTRLDDAVALAAAAAKHSALPRRRSGGTLSLLARAVLYPFRLLFHLLLLPLNVSRFLLASVGEGPNRQVVPPATATARGGRSGMGSRASPRYDRVPSRVTRR
ncbi:hypothetical protein L249_7188 [Ophiocordyceps polyrhachis-furcata BCC 54312]|uniref:Uncharacterized protein n=1 Tax=Ophiocordyceps polyrhachis-furcata BCC 54312 TaxID=1330021 RepID=A0A367L9J5_9HYPO|nr:hypothetical protein L249_7188 [Ophiocordyceps polyrhachis-furcata BCC 54312]